MSPETFYLRQDNMPFTYNMSPETYNNVSKKSFLCLQKCSKTYLGTLPKSHHIYLKKNPYMGKAQFEIGDLRQKFSGQYL